MGGHGLHQGTGILAGAVFSFCGGFFSGGRACNGCFGCFNASGNALRVIFRVLAAGKSIRNIIEHGNAFFFQAGNRVYERYVSIAGALGGRSVCAVIFSDGYAGSADDGASHYARGLSNLGKLVHDAAKRVV